MSAVSVDALSKRYGRLMAVDGITFDVADGQLLAILGPNGAGKSTTLEMLEGFLAPTSGAVRVLGADPCHGDRAWRSRVGLVLQTTSLDAELTVRDTLRLFAGLYPAARPVDEAIELVDLVDDAFTKVGALSGGQRRRVDLAIGVIGRPDILFLDEPTTGLDPEARRNAWVGVENLAASGTTVVLTTHYIEEADQLADRVIVLASGRIAADTTPAALRRQGGPSTIRYTFPDCVDAAGLPASLASHLGADGRTVVIRSPDTAIVLRDLLVLAGRRGLDLSGLEVGPPSLEDAYLAIIGATGTSALTQPYTPSPTASALREATTHV